MSKFRGIILQLREQAEEFREKAEKAKLSSMREAFNKLATLSDEAADKLAERDMK